MESVFATMDILEKTVTKRHVTRIAMMQECVEMDSVYVMRDFQEKLARTQYVKIIAMVLCCMAQEENVLKGFASVPINTLDRIVLC